MDAAQARAEKIEYFRAQAEQFHFTREYSKAMTFYVRAGLLGDVDSIREVCLKLKSGYGMSYNFEEVFRCMQVGAQAGIADAMYELGVCYSTGLGVEVDQAKAMYWFSEGAKAGSKEAKESLRTYNYDISIAVYDEPSPYAEEVRKAVFQQEQGLVDALDEIDARAKHFVVFDGSKSIATCRLYWEEQQQLFMVGRFAVKKEYRGIGIGGLLMEEVFSYVAAANGKTIVLYSQMQAKGFYEKYGFEPEGEAELVQGCAQIRMCRRFL